MRPQVTRGKGWLEYRLSQKRAFQAGRLIPIAARQGSLLDLGCGSHPYFLLTTVFQDKIGMDSSIHQVSLVPRPGCTLLPLNFQDRLPFDDSSLDVVTALAVIEHVERKKLPNLLREIHRVLRPGGCFILTTPASWTHELLHLLAFLNLVSKDEIFDHKHLYSMDTLKILFAETDFQSLSTGSFELGMNLWVRATK